MTREILTCFATCRGNGGSASPLFQTIDKHQEYLTHPEFFTFNFFADGLLFSRKVILIKEVSHFFATTLKYIAPKSIVFLECFFDFVGSCNGLNTCYDVTVFSCIQQGEGAVMTTDFSIQVTVWERITPPPRLWITSGRAT